jgi:acylphosphatase
MARVHVWIRGRVQGVFFRDSTQQAATRLGLAGWVRNMPDGRVEAVFQGDADACDDALDYVRRGPPSARVEGVDVRWEEDEAGLTGFRIVG